MPLAGSKGGALALPCRDSPERGRKRRMLTRRSALVAAIPAAIRRARPRGGQFSEFRCRHLCRGDRRGHSARRIERRLRRSRTQPVRHRQGPQAGRIHHDLGAVPRPGHQRQAHRRRARRRRASNRALFGQVESSFHVAPSVIAGIWGARSRASACRPATTGSSRPSRHWRGRDGARRSSAANCWRRCASSTMATSPRRA